MRKGKHNGYLVEKLNSFVPILTFHQFVLSEGLEEQEHSCCPYKEWGVIHPKTGKTTSGDRHPTATIHSDLKQKMREKNSKLTSKHTKEYPEYGHAEHDKPSGYLMVRGINKGNAHAVGKAYHKLS